MLRLTSFPLSTSPFLVFNITSTRKKKQNREYNHIIRTTKHKEESRDTKDVLQNWTSGDQPGGIVGKVIMRIEVLEII
jgi:hypothetical protein